MVKLARRLAAVALGVAVDRVVPEPPNRWHPVARFGSLMSGLEQRVWRDRIDTGAAYALAGVVGATVVGRLVPSTSGATSTAVAGHELRRVASSIIDELDRGGLGAARASLPALVGRDPSSLDEAGVCAAVIESVAENTVDALVAPVFWAVVAGAPGALGYRAINTMDAMVGHRSERYEHFGKASARLDDVANYVPARLTALLFAAANRERAGLVATTVRRDAGAHPSPNAGVAESAMAAAIGAQLGGPLRYGDRHEDRPTLGDGPRPDVAAARRAIATAERAENLLIGVLVVAAVIGWRR